MTDPELQATADFMTAVLPPAFFTDENLICFVLCRMANLSRDHGLCNASCLAFTYLGMVLGRYFGEYPAGYRFGKLGFDLVAARGLMRFEARVAMCFPYHVLPWTKPMRSGCPWLRRAFDFANEAGDLTYGSFSSCTLVTNGSPIVDDHGVVIGTVLVFRDISERRQVEETLRKAQADMANMARLTTMGELAASIAHEVNQPLVAIVTNELVADILVLMRGELRRQWVTIETDLSPGLPLVAGDRTRVLRITTRKDEQGDVTFGVEDNGIGLDEAQIDRIFDAFFATKPNGMSMGLAICRSIVKTHGRTLWATLQVPHGSLLQFTLPSTDAQVGRMTPG